MSAMRARSASPMRTPEQLLESCARTILWGYRLSHNERTQETEGLAAVLITAATGYLENLEHRRQGEEVGR